MYAVLLSDIGSVSQQFSARDMPSHTVLKMRYGCRLWSLGPRETIPEVKVPDDIKKIESRLFFL